MSTTSISRGNVVVALWTDKHTGRLKARPAIVIQSDTFEPDDGMVIMVPFTTDTRLPSLGCRVMVRMGTDEQRVMNTLSDSLILADKVSHVPYRHIDRVIGGTPEGLLREIEAGLRRVLGL